MEYGCRRAFTLICLLCVASPGVGGADTGEMTLSEVYRRVEALSPDLAASAAVRSAAGEGVRQARARPNPELEIEMEDFGSGPIEVMVTQAVAIGGVRGAGIRRALAQRDVAQYDLESAHIHHRAEAMRRFASVIAARQNVGVADSLVALAQATMASIRRRVEIGSAMPVDSIRAEIELREIRLRRTEAIRDYGQARRDLAALWGDLSEPAWEPAGDFECAPFPLPGDQVLRAVETHPAMKAMAAEVQATMEDRSEAEAEV
ncbi:MAG: TolC family protein, partial [Candidatus Eisenbacteria bacterium]|nr:TolC family protein [Candidatus Eisenbacteria bacterium]